MNTEPRPLALFRLRVRPIALEGWIVSGHLTLLPDRQGERLAVWSVECVEDQRPTATVRVDRGSIEEWGSVAHVVGEALAIADVPCKCGHSWIAHLHEFPYACKGVETPDVGFTQRMALLRATGANVEKIAGVPGVIPKPEEVCTCQGFGAAKPTLMTYMPHNSPVGGGTP